MSGFTEARELKERVRQLSSRQQELLAQAEKEDRDLNDSEQQEWDRLHEKQGELTKRAQRLVEHEDRQKALDEEMRAGEGVRAGKEDRNGGDDPEGRKRGADEEQRKAVNDALARWTLGEHEQGDVETLRSAGFDMRSGGKEMHLGLWDAANLSEQRQARREGRAQSTTAAEGGYSIPQTLVARIEQAMLDFGGMRESGATIIRTSAGEAMTIPTVDDTGNAGALLAENTQVSEQDMTFGQKTLNAYKYTSKLVRVSRELLQDAAVDLPSFLGSALGERIGRITNQHFTTGTGSAQPNGVVTAATSAATTAAPTTVSYDELVALVHSVDPAYRRQDPRFMFSDATLKVLKQMKDGDGKPLWLSGIAVREPDTILGHQYVINQDVADIATTAKAILFGAFRYYWIRDVLGITLLRLEERYADYFQIGWVGFSRHDGELVSAGAPIKYLTQA